MSGKGLFAGAQLAVTPTTDDAGNTIFQLQVVAAPGASIIGKVSIDQTTPGTTNGVVVTPAKETTATRTDVAAAAADTVILAANTNRLPGSAITNDSTSIMYVLLGSGVASATNYTVAIDGKSTVPGTYFLPDGWTGAVHGYWASATGNARVTELSA